MKKRITLLCLVLCLLLPLAAAAQPLEPEHAASLTLRVREGESGIPGVYFDVFRVAEMDARARYRLLEAYQAEGTDPNAVKGAAAWAALAEKLAALTDAPTASAFTGQNGDAVFPGLKTGLYLVVGYPAAYGGKAYDFAPFLAAVPGEGDGAWDYAPVAEVKYTQSPLLRDIRILKYWQDGGAASRPGEILVALYRDGAQYATIALNEANGWQHTYTGLESAHRWSVQELSVPSGYSVSYTEADGAFIVINTLQTPPQPPASIPQTGLVWWPVPVLAVLGLALITVGLVLRRKWSGTNE